MMNFNLDFITSQQSINFVKTAAVSIAVGYIAMKVVSVVSSVAFAVFFGIATHLFVTNEKYRTDDTLENIRNLTIDTVTTITDFIVRVTNVFRVARQPS